MKKTTKQCAICKEPGYEGTCPEVEEYTLTSVCRILYMVSGTFPWSKGYIP